MSSHERSINWFSAILLPIAAMLAACGHHGPASAYRQLTFDVGETSSPAISRDGKFIVYASDRAQPKNLDIWVQPVDEGQAVRLTNDPANDYDPAFAGDGKSVYFTSLRQPNGVYRVPVTGGAAELVARGAVAPCVSPDGKTLVFVANDGNLATLESGTSARPLLQNFNSSYTPKWSPDSREILFTGRAAKDDDVDWWVIPASGGAPRQTGLLGTLKRRGFSAAYAQAWLPGDEIIFAGKRVDRITLWRLKLSPDRTQIIGQPERATDDDSGDFRAFYGAGRLAFDRIKGAANFWALPADVNHGQALGLPRRLTATDARKGSAAVSSDGRELLYSADQHDTFHFVLTDLVHGTEKPIGPKSNPFYAVLSRDGSRYYYGTGARGMIDVFTRGVSGWHSWWSSSVCNRCGMPRGLSSDGRFLLLFDDTENNTHVDLLDLMTNKPQPVLRNVSMQIYGPELSPDAKWISFVAKTGKHSWRAYIAPITPAGASSEYNWIPATANLDGFLMPFWSPDGNLLYFLNEHGEGNINWLDAQKLDPESKRPLGLPFNVYRFREGQTPGMDPIWNHPAVTSDKIILELGEVSTNVWMMEVGH